LVLSAMFVFVVGAAVRGMGTLLSMGGFRISGPRLAGIRTVRLIGAQLRVFSLDTVLARLLVIALHLPLAARPARSSYSHHVVRRKKKHEILIE
jgi:hypothetical protein